MGQAAALLKRLAASDGDQISLEWNEDLPDVLHALCRSMRQHAVNTRQEKLFMAAIAAYDLIERISWPEDPFEERSEILACIAFAAWNESRKSGRHAQMALFEERCERHVLEREEVRDFLALPFEQRSPALRARFLSDAAALLTNLARLTRQRDLVPEVVAREAPQLYEWILVEGCRPMSAEEAAYFVGQAALSASAAFRHLGEFREAERWLGLAVGAFERTMEPVSLRATTEYARLTILYDTGKYDEVLEAVPALIDAFETQGMEREVAKARFLEANALKAVGSELALPRFAELARNPAIRRDTLLFGLCLVHLGELSAHEGRHRFAMRCLGDARPLLETAGVCFGLALLRSAVAEVLRDQGRLAAAIEAYRSSIEMYVEGGFSCRAAYLRVVLAETLLAADRDVEATLELMAALPVIERESLTREGVAAVALLRASLRRRGADPEVLRKLRDQLDRMQGEGQL